mgnify:CR=1 FL=1
MKNARGGGPTNFSANRHSTSTAPQPTRWDGTRPSAADERAWHGAQPDDQRHQRDAPDDETIRELYT